MHFSVAVMWMVVVIAKDPQNRRVFELSADATVGEVRSLWRSSLENPSPVICRRVDRSRLADDATLAEVGELTPGSMIVNILVDEALEVYVEFYKRQREGRLPLVINADEKPEDLHPKIRTLFGLGEDDVFRLITDDGPLLYGVTFDDQEVEEGGRILVDFAFEIDTVDDWTSSTEKRLIYASEKAADLLSDTDAPQRLLLGGVAMGVAGDVLDSLPVEERRFAPIIVQHQRQHRVSVLRNGGVRQAAVWPTDSTARLVSLCGPHKDALLEGTPLPKDAACRTAKIPDHAVVYSSTSVTVKCSDGKRRIVDVPDCGTVADVEEAVRKLEGRTNISLKCGDKYLEKDEKIAKVVLNGEGIEVAQDCLTVTVRLRDRCVRFSSGESRLRFTDIVRKVAECGKLKVKSLVHRPLQCQGCRRTLTLDEEAFQAIPSDCCRLRSLQLVDATPVSRKGERLMPRKLTIIHRKCTLT